MATFSGLAVTACPAYVGGMGPFTRGTRIALLLALAALGVLAPPAAATGGAQLWLARFDGPAHNTDYADSVAVSPDGTKIYVTGTSQGVFPAGQDYGTVAYDAATGVQLWVARYDFHASCCGVDRASALALSPDGTRVYVTGQSGNAPVIATVAYDAGTGAQLWVARSAVAGTPAGIAVSGDGARVFVAGTRSGPVDYATLAYDAATGAQLWSVPYNGAANRDDRVGGLGVSRDGTLVYVTGTSQQSSSPKVVAATTIAYDAANGSQRWIDHFSDLGYASANALAVGADGNRLFVTGTSRLANGPTTLAYTASTGTRLWSNRYGGAAGTAVAVAASPDGARVFSTSWTAGAVSGAVDYTTLGYDAATGAQSWVSRYTGPVNGDNRVRAIGVSPDSSLVFVTGSSPGAGTSDDYATVAYGAADGTQAWAARYSGPVNGSDYAYSLALSPDGTHLFVTGTIDRSTDYGTIAYDTGITPRSAALAVPVDVRPDQCPNRLKLASTETLAVDIAGAVGFDTRSVDPASVRLEGVAPLRYGLSDVTTPYSPYTGKTSSSQCINPGPDGVRDLALKFSTPSLAAALAGHRAGDVVVLHLTGSLKDGTPIVGEDVVVLA